MAGTLGNRPPTVKQQNARRSTGREAQPREAQPNSAQGASSSSAAGRAHGSATSPAALATLSSSIPPSSTQPGSIEAKEAPEPAPSWWGHRSLLFKFLIIFLVPPTLFLFGFTTQQSLYRTEYTWTSPTNNGLTHLPSPFVMHLEIDTTAHAPLLAPPEHAHCLTDLLTTHQAAQSSLSHLASRATHDLACTFRYHHHHHQHNRIRPSSSSSSSSSSSGSMSNLASPTPQHTLTTVWSIHNLTKHTLTHLTALSTHSGYLPLEHLYPALLRQATVQLEASHVSPEQRQRMSVLPKLYFDSSERERDHWSEYTRARAAVAEVAAAVAALEREKGVVVAMEEVVARFADRLGGLGEFLLTNSPRAVVVGHPHPRSRPSSRWWWSWPGEPEEVVGREEEEEEAMREYLKWWFFDNVVLYTGTRWAVFEQDWHGLGCEDGFK